MYKMVPQTGSNERPRVADRFQERIQNDTNQALTQDKLGTHHQIRNEENRSVTSDIAEAVR